MPLFTSLSVQRCRRRWRKHHLWNYFGCFVGCHAPCILGIFYGSPSILGCQKPLRKGEKAACPRGDYDVSTENISIDDNYMYSICSTHDFRIWPPVVEKFLIYISLKKKHIGIPKPGFPKLHFSSGWMLKMHLVPSGICVGNLLQPLQELLGITGGRLARWPGIFRFSRKVGSVVCWTHMYYNWLFVETPGNCKLPFEVFM